MNIITSTILLVACLAYSQQPALAESGSQCIAQFDKSNQREGCVCDKSLSNLQATFPKPMKLVAACGLYWPSNGKKINLSLQKVSLDQYTDGNYPAVEIFVTGKAQLSGELHYEVGETEYLSFTPQHPFVSAQYEALASYLSNFRFKVDSTLLRRFRVPRALDNSQCFTANTTIEIDGIYLLTDESDGAGAWPINFKVLKISGFKNCGGNDTQPGAEPDAPH